MSGRHWLGVLALVAAAGSVACSDSTGPTAPLQKKASLASPTGASFGRYILISGVVTCVEDCDDSGPGERVEGVPATSPDTLEVLGLPADTSIAP
jgi:hypothetical protein